MAKVIYIVRLNDLAAVKTRGREIAQGNPVMTSQTVFAFTRKDAAQDFCRRRTHIDGSDPWMDGPTDFMSIDPATRRSKHAYITEIPLDPAPTLPGMEGV